MFNYKMEPVDILAEGAHAKGNNKAEAQGLNILRRQKENSIPGFDGDALDIATTMSGVYQESNFSMTSVEVNFCNSQFFL